MRKERPHPGAQLSFTDADGHRFQLVLTDRLGDPRALEREHRARGDAENRVRAAKACGLQNLPFRAFARNELWLELVICALDLVAWTQALVPDGALATAEPKTLRYRLLHTAGQLTRHARRLTLHLPAAGPWSRDLVAALPTPRRAPRAVARHAARCIRNRATRRSALPAPAPTSLSRTDLAASRPPTLPTPPAQPLSRHSRGFLANPG